MPLPSSMEARREQLKNESQAPAATPSSAVPQNSNEPPTPPNNEPPSNEPPQLPNNEDGRVTITRKEFNELQGAKDRLTAAERRAEAQKDDLEAMQRRLTELEEASKAGGKPPAAPAPGQPASLTVDATQIPLTEKEKEDFEEDTIALMDKVATNVFRRMMPDIISSIESRLGEIESTARNAVKTVGQTTTNAFTERVRAKVAEFSDFDTIVTHPQWQDFVVSYNDLTGEQYGQIIQKHVTEQKPTGVTSIAAIFRTFYDKYIKDVPSNDGYRGAIPSGVGTVDTNSGTPAVKMLKYSDRKKLHDDYIAKRIKYEDYQTKKEEFDLADREGRLDYNS